MQMTRIAMAKALWPFLVAGAALCLSIGFGAGWVTNGWRLDAKVQACERRCSDERADAEAQAFEKLTKAVERNTNVLMADRQQENRVLTILEQDRRMSAIEVEELKHAIDASTARACYAPGPWRVLASKVARINRKHATLAARAGIVLERPGASAGTGRIPVRCDTAFEYANRVVDAWDELATRCRGLQSVVKTRQSIVDRWNQDN